MEAPARERCDSAVGLPLLEAPRRQGRAGHRPDRDTTEDTLDVPSARAASSPKGDGLGLASQTPGAHLRGPPGNPAARRPWKPAGGACAGDEGCPRLGRCRERLLQPIGRGRSVARGAERRRPVKSCRAQRRHVRGGAVERLWNESVEADRGDKPGHPARMPAPRERCRAGRDAHVVTNDARVA
jgi:hypothetical protein